jgi:hypothetical protein
MRAALGLDEPLFGPASAIEQAKSPDTFLIFAPDLLPLRLCTFAPLRSFLPTAGISARDPLPKQPYARSCPSPPPPPTPPAKALGARGSQAVWGGCAYSSSQSPGGEGGKRFGGFRRVGGAGFAAQTTIEHGVIV